MKRLFLALWPQKTVRERLRKITRVMDTAHCRPVIPENFHVTLVFIGALQAAKIAGIEHRMASIAGESFVIQFDRLSYWRKPKIVCLTCEKIPAAIIELVVQMQRAILDCGIELDERIYKPHITLARHAHHKPSLTFQPLLWPASSFCLVESANTPSGVIYKVLRDWPLS